MGSFCFSNNTDSEYLYRIFNQRNATMKSEGKEQGFTLIELMIVIAIIGILAAVAVPQYSSYTKRSKFAEVITQTNSAKTTVSLCFQVDHDIATCNGTGLATDFAGMYPDVASPGIGHLESLTTVAGVITATGTQETDGATYILTPIIANSNTLTWSIGAGSTCLTDGLCKEF